MPKRHKIGVFDEETAEKLGDAYFHEKYKIHPSIVYGEGRFGMVGFDAIETFALDNSLPPPAKNIFIFLLSQLEYDNWINLRQKDIGERLRMDKANVSRYMKLLVERKMLLKFYRKDGTFYKYRLSLAYGFKGTLDGKVEQDTQGGWNFNEVEMVKKDLRRGRVTKFRSKNL